MIGRTVCDYLLKLSTSFARIGPKTNPSSFVSPLPTGTLKERRTSKESTSLGVLSNRRWVSFESEIVKVMLTHQSINRQIFLKEVEKRGVDLMDASSGGLTPKQKIDVGPSYQVSWQHLFPRFSSDTHSSLSSGSLCRSSQSRSVYPHLSCWIDH